MLLKKLKGTTTAFSLATLFFTALALVCCHALALERASPKSRGEPKTAPQVLANLKGNQKTPPGDQQAMTAEVKQLVKGLSEQDVAWGGQFIGIVAHLKSDRAKRLVEIGEPAIPELIKALSDKSKYATAHAILTVISKVEHSYIPYNGLRVNFTADGETMFYPEDGPVLARRWQKWYATTPRPKELPD